jgi:C4-dicarboxylate transporter DctM subunit
MGPIIPPSIIMIVYGSMTGVSIGAMFLGGAIPGIIIGLGLMAVVYAYSYLPGYEFLAKKSAFVKTGTLWQTFKDGFLTLITPAIIIGGIVFGVFTATEGGAIAAAYAFIVGYFVYGELKLADLENILENSAVTAAVVLLVTGIAGAFGWILTYAQFPEDIANYLIGITTSQDAMLALIVGFLLILTCFVETLPALIMMTPVFYQICNQLHFDPVHFGVVVCIAAFIGTVTPPVGVLLYVTTSIAGCELKDTVRHLPAFLAVLVAVALLVTFVPPVVTFLPHLILK